MFHSKVSIVLDISVCTEDLRLQTIHGSRVLFHCAFPDTGGPGCPDLQRFSFARFSFRCVELEIESKRKLDLPLGSLPHSTLYRRIENTECACGSRGVRLPRLQLIGPGSQDVRKSRRRIREICDVEYVEEFGPELNVRGLGNAEVLVQDEVQLSEVRPMKGIAHHIAESAWRRYCERCRIQKSSICVEKGIDARDHIGSPDVA